MHKYHVLDTSPEPAYDEITRLTAALCQVPTAVISLVDAERQWFKSKIGLEVSQTHRDLALCAHAILDPEHVLEVKDALQDERFATNPLVTLPPKMRFYAGAPLVAPSGEAVGALCAIDVKPHALTAEQREGLRELAARVMALLEARS